MTTLLILIYIAFISLGLPDAIMGSAWPILHIDLNVPVTYAGIFSMIVSCGTIVSSLLSERLIIRFGTGKITVISVMATAIGLLGIYLSPSYLWICLLAIPLGLGAGAVDSALNNFIALHYKAKHMSWLHCFWGIGATAGPLIMSFFLLRGLGWRLGYGSIGLIQVLLVICLFASLPLWRKIESSSEETKSITSSKGATRIADLLKLPAAKPALIAFFCYCAVETTAGLWGSSYLVMVKGISAEQAAQWVAIYYFGITIGRLFSGFVAIKLNNTKLIRLGQIIGILGAVTLLLPLPTFVQLIGLLLIGFGLAPIFPSMLHDTPNRFGKEMSQGIMGIQMATAYVGQTLVPPLFGLLASVVSFQLLPFFLLGLFILMLFTSEIVKKSSESKDVKM